MLKKPEQSEGPCASCGALVPPVFPGSFRRSGDFLCLLTKNAPRTPPFSSAAPRIRRLFSSSFLPLPHPPGTFHQGTPSFRSSSATVRRPSRPRLTSPAQSTAPFTPYPSPAPHRPTTPLRRGRARPPRSGRQGRFVPRRSRSGPGVGKASTFSVTRLP